MPLHRHVCPQTCRLKEDLVIGAVINVEYQKTRFSKQRNLRALPGQRSALNVIGCHCPTVHFPAAISSTDFATS